MQRIIILLTIFVAVKGNGCIRLSFGEIGNVCVCNSTYCDTIERPQLQSNQFLWYTSTKAGKMMEYTINNFSIKNEHKNESKATVLILDRNQKYQQILGFGGAMTDAAALNIKTLSDEAQQQLLKSYFSPTGSRYSFCRIPIGGTDFSTRPYTYDDVAGDTKLNNFNLVEEDNLKIQYLHNIKNMTNNLKIFTTTWSSPAWMKNSHNIKWGALKREYYQTFASYIKKFFDAYKERGIEIWGITPNNEPLDGFLPFFIFNAMAWLPDKVADWSVNYLAPTLSKAGYENLVYMAMDDQRTSLPWYPDMMFKNLKAKELFSGIAFHWYRDTTSSPNKLIETHMKYSDKFILMTEACTGTSSTNLLEPRIQIGSWKRGEQYMSDIIENFKHWVTGWVDWNLALNEIGGPNWVHNYVDSPIIVIPQKDEFYKQPMYYAISHFSNFVPRGSYVIFSTLKTNLPENIASIAFLTPDLGVTVVIINKGNDDVALTIEDENRIINIEISARSFNSIYYNM